MKWKEVKISSFTNVVTGGTPSTTERKYWEKGTLPWLNSGDLNKGEINEASNFITELGLRNSSARMMPPATVLIALTGATTGVTAILNIGACANQSVTGILPSEKHSPRFLYYFLKSQREKILRKTWGGAQPHINQKYVKDFLVPLPPLTDQLHIANILTKAENLISQRKESIRLLDEYLKSTFSEMFGDTVRNEKGWEKRKLKDVCNRITDGTHFSPPIKKEGIPYVTAKHVRENKIDFFSNPWFISEQDHKDIYKRCDPKKGDVLYIKDGATTGYAAINKYNFEFSMLSSLALLKPNKTVCNSEYLCAWLNNPIVKSRILLGMAGGAIQRLTLTKINDLPINLPNLSLQSSFAQIVEKTEALKIHYLQSLLELENLYGSLSQRAFRGDLNFKDKELMIAAEPEVSYIVSNSSIPEIKRGFAKQVLGGKIVSLFKDDKNFTHIKFQKIQYLAEHFVGEDLLWNYYRQSAGPYDNKFMHNVSDRLKQNKWFEERNFRFYPLEKANDIDRYYKNYFGNKNEHLNKLFFLLKNSSEKFCEAVATIYAVWNNHVILKQNFDAENIKHDFFEWSCRKTDVFTEDEFDKALQWMQKHEIVPTGFGQLIKENVRKKV
jgi:type I restriction enzyme S subunit